MVPKFVKQVKVDGSSLGNKDSKKKILNKREMKKKITRQERFFYIFIYYYFLKIVERINAINH